MALRRSAQLDDPHGRAAGEAQPRPPAGAGGRGPQEAPRPVRDADGLDAGADGRRDGRCLPGRRRRPHAQRGHVRAAAAATAGAQLLRPRARRPGGDRPRRPRGGPRPGRAGRPGRPSRRSRRRWRPTSAPLAARRRPRARRTTSSAARRRRAATRARATSWSDRRRRRPTGRPRTGSTCPATGPSRPTRRRWPTSPPSCAGGPIRSASRRCSSGPASRWPRPRWRR